MEKYKIDCKNHDSQDLVTNVKSFEKWYENTKQDKNIDNFCKEENISLSRNEKINLLLELVKKDVFGYSTLLSNSISLVADIDEQFIALLEEIVRVTNGDLAIGWFEMALIKIGKENNTLGIELANKLKKSTTLFDFSSTPLGGVGYNDFSKIEKIVDSMLSSNDPKEIVLGLRIIRIAFRKKQLYDNYEIFSKIETAIKINNETINIEATMALLEFYEYNQSFCQTQLLQLVKSNDKIKNLISHHLWIHPISNATNAIMLIRECYNTTNSSLQFTVFYALGNYTTTNYKEIMVMIRTAFENKAQPYGHLEYLITKLGKDALFPALNEFESWLDTDNFHLKFCIPRFIVLLIPSGQRQSCFSYFERWSDNKDIPKDLFLKIYKRVLATCYGNNFDQDFVQSSKTLLIKLVTKDRINLTFLLKDEDDETLQCARMINGLEYYSFDLNYDRILSNVELFQNLKDLLTTTWILQKKQENNRTNLLLRVLERELPDDSKINKIIEDIGKSTNMQEYSWHQLRLGNHVHDFFYLQNIEQKIQNLKNNELNIYSHFRSKLQNDEQVDDTISEINILGLLAEHYELKLEAPVGTRNIDSLIVIDGQKLYLEVINPSEFLPLELFEGEVFTIPNRAKNKILDKCERQLSQIPEEDIPAILAIDIQGSDIDIDSVTDALYGSTKYTFLMDKKTGEERGGYWSLNDNSIHTTKTISDVLSGVLCFKSEMLNNMKFYITGKLIPNPNAKNHLILHIIKRIEEIITKIED
jgi:hypothetical protein